MSVEKCTGTVYSVPGSCRSFSFQGTEFSVEFCMFEKEVQDMFVMNIMLMITVLIIESFHGMK